MPLITADELRERFDIDGNILDPRLNPHIATASRRLRSWVGETDYEAVLALALIPATEEGADTTGKVDVLKNAEAHLTMHYATLGLNATLSAKGMYVTTMASEG